MIPWYLRHYERFADRINIWDDRSSDGSAEMLRSHPKVNLQPWPYDNGIDEDKFLEFAYEQYPKAESDWVMWVDMDEFIFSEQSMPSVLDSFKDWEALRPQGFAMTGDLPKVDYGQQLWETCRLGIPSGVYCKPVIFRPSCEIRWIRGKHNLENCEPKISYTNRIKLLHYRFMGHDYTLLRNAKNYARCGLRDGNKGAAWSCSPEWKGDHSAVWAIEAADNSVMIV